MNTIIKISLLVLTVLLLSACSTWYEEPEVAYVIEAGKHKSNVEGSLPGNGVRALKSEVLRFRARFDQTAIYDLGNDNQYDVNKLFGFSDCNSHHQENSARFGWNYDLKEAQINVYAYLYVNGKRRIETLGALAIHEDASYALRVTNTHFIFTFNGMETSFERGSDCSVGLYLLLYPYFGGNTPAPHDIRIYIQEQP